MTKSTVTPSPEATENAENAEDAKSHFAKAVEEAKAGAQALGKDAQERAGSYADAYREKVSKTGGEAMDKAFHFANEGKAKASEAIAGLGKLVEENAPTIDEKVGAKYGDYARSAARSMQDAAARLDAKELNEIGEDAKEFVRKKPGLAIGIAAAAGFALARLFKGSKGSDAEDAESKEQE